MRIHERERPVKQAQAVQPGMTAPTTQQHLQHLRQLVRALDAQRRTGSTACPLCHRLTGQDHARGCAVAEATR